MKKKSIASRYGTNTITNGYYQTIITGASGSSTTTLSSTSSSSTSGTTYLPYTIGTSTFTYQYPKVSIEVLGKTFEIIEDTFQQLYLAQIDFHGIGFYKSLKKTGLLINDEDVENYLTKLLQAEERDDKIEKILKNL